MAKGNCYEASGKYFMDNCLFDEDKQKRFRLVHGKPRLTRPPFKRFGHAWIEIDENIVYDAERMIEIPIGLYYAVGNINPEDCRVYTYDQMQKEIQEHEHWGPWNG